MRDVTDARVIRRQNEDWPNRTLHPIEVVSKRRQDRKMKTVAAATFPKMPLPDNAHLPTKMSWDYLPSSYPSWYPDLSF
jgi:hypothetical protein